MIGVKSEGPLSKTADLSVVAIIGIVAIGLGIIGTVGITVGFVGRPGNCVKQSTLPTNLPPTIQTTIPPITVPTTTTTASTSSTTRTVAPQSTASPQTQGSTATIPTVTTASTTRTNPATSTQAVTTMSPATQPITTQSTTTPTPPTTTTSTATRPTQTVPPLTTPRSTPTTTPLSEFRLPKNVMPTRQDILLRFDFNPYLQAPEGAKLNYTGETTIRVNVVEPTNTIFLHIDEEIGFTDPNVVVTNLDTNENLLIQSTAFIQYQRYRIALLTTLTANGNYSILFKFKSLTTTQGLYYHGYNDGFGSRSLLATRFFPIEARTVFPCFDEPSFKTSYVITIEHPERSIALSNFPQASKTLFQDPTSGQSKYRTIFQPTYAMSSYLVSWAVIPDDFQSRSLAGQTPPVNVWGRKSEIENNYADFALNIVPQLINAMVTYTGISEALPPKIDLIALPFYPQITSPSWGLNAFREDFLLYNPKYDSELVQSGIAETLAKDIAANWFGNYITCSFWDDLWLNEGFSIYFGFKILGIVLPQLDVDNKFITTETVPTMWRDAYQRVQPLKYDFNSNIDVLIEAVSDVRGKSASIIRMIEASVDAAQFREDVISYLTNHAFGVTTSNYFYFIFRSPNPAAISMKDWIEPWIIQKNYPIVTVQPRVQGQATVVDFTQARFSLSRANLEFPDPPKNYSWAIFLRCKAGGDANSPNGGQVQPFDFLLTDKTATYPLGRIFNWVKCNNDFKGFYMTNYSDSQLQTFEQVILTNRDTFSIGDRANLIHLSFELAFVGYKSYAIPSYLTVYLDSLEDKVVPWETFIYHIDKLGQLIQHRASYANLRGFTIQILRNAISRLGLDIWSDSTDHDQELLKINFADTLCRLGDSVSLLKVKDLFESIPPLYFESPFDHVNPISPNIRGIVYKYHLENTNDYNDWFRLYDFYGEANDLREREYTVVALANTRLYWNYDYVLKESINLESKLNRQAAYALMIAMGRNPTGRYYSWYFIREFWGEMLEKGFNLLELGATMRIISSSFENVLFLEEVELFFDQNFFPVPNLRRQIEESIIINSYWIQFLEKDFQQFFFELGRKLDI